jgi:peptidylprolyl isomerase
MKKIAPILIACLGFSLAATAQTSGKAKNKSEKNNSNVITTPSGLQYEILQKGTGKMPVKGGKVSVHYTGKLTNDTVFDSSIKRGQPISFKLGVGQVIKGWDEGIALLHVGEKARFTIPSNLGYGERAVGSIPANSTLIFDVELVDAQDPFVAVPYDVKGLDTLTTASGLKYLMVKKNPEGTQAKSGMKVTVHYTGYLLDGKMFDSSLERGQPIEFGLGQGQVIAGWDEGIALLKTGEKARLVIPYQQAYGESGRPPIIPAKATLVFDVELLMAE